MAEPLPPRLYAERVLGKAAKPGQLDELFQLHAAAHPVVQHGRWARTFRGPDGEYSWPCKVTVVEVWSNNPVSPGNRTDVLAKGTAICGPNDRYDRQRGVAIAFGRALKALRVAVDPPAVPEKTRFRLMITSGAGALPVEEIESELDALDTLTEILGELAKARVRVSGEIPIGFRPPIMISIEEVE